MTEERLKTARAKLNALGTIIDKIEKELKPMKDEFLSLWQEKNKLEQKLFLEQGKIKVFKMGVSGRPTKPTAIKVETMTPEMAQKLLDMLANKG